MHVVKRVAIPTASRSFSRHACRIIAGVRRPCLTHGFHRSATACRIPESPPNSTTTRGEAKNLNKTPGESGRTVGPSANDGEVGAAEVDESVPTTEAQDAETVEGCSEAVSKGRTGYGSASRRLQARQQKNFQEVPPICLPPWFWDSSVKLYQHPRPAESEIFGESTQTKSADLPTVDDHATGIQESQDANTSNPAAVNGRQASPYAVASQDAAVADTDVVASAGMHNVVINDAPLISEDSKLHMLDGSHQIDDSLLAEIGVTLSALLKLRPPIGINSKDLFRPDTVLFCPSEEGSMFLNDAVSTLAKNNEADLVQLTSENLGQIVGDYVGENVAYTYSETSMLGYDAHRLSGKIPSLEIEDTTEENIGGEDAGVSDLGSNLRVLGRMFNPKKMSKASGSVVKVAFPGSMSQPISLNDFLGSSASSGPAASTGDAWKEYKLTAVLEKLVDSAAVKRDQESDHVGFTEQSETISGLSNSKTDKKIKSSRPLIIQICDYHELAKLPQGLNILKKLREIVKKRWVGGSEIVIVGTTTAELHEPARSATAIRQIQNNADRDYRVIYVPPPRDSLTKEQFERDDRSVRISINARNILHMVQSLGGTTYDGTPSDFVYVLDNVNCELPRSSSEVLDWPDVYRIAIAILGACQGTSQFTDAHARLAMSQIESSDQYKFEWMKEESIAQLDQEQTSSGSSPEQNTIRKLAVTKHEKKLVGGIVQPASIRVTFDDIRAPASTVEALKTLTSLSLQRPDAFTYGILAKDRIPGILLYGPPGTGKTMLAKAVAKESGATVLEVSGSEIYDKYVGEGEKNIKAVFSLARKLSPCVIFIDEADAIFGTRGADSTRRSHRELINQFLKELDGITDLTALLMVATNRPFDLDEAVLRRLPRRILVDLPLQNDREAILKLQLAEESLDPSVSLADIATDTPFYSGSDLKNLSVAAALACVREENDAAKLHSGSEPYVYPKKRVLTKSHFDKAMEEISASISEDMGTLGAIRKFDERYGDRKGRRKKKGGFGFGNAPPEKDSEAGRVRKVAEAEV